MKGYVSTLDGFVTGRLKDLGLTKKSCAAQLGMDPKQLNRYLANPKNLDVITVCVLAKIIETPVDVLCAVAYEMSDEG